MKPKDQGEDKNLVKDTGEEKRQEPPNPQPPEKTGEDGARKEPPNPVLLTTRAIEVW